jgi:hypothetical protein
MSLRHLVGTGLFALVLLLGATATLYWLTLRYAAEVRLPVLQQMVAAAQEAEAERERVFLQQNLNSMPRPRSCRRRTCRSASSARSC